MLDERLFKITRQYLVHFQGSRLCIPFGEAKRCKVLLVLWEIIFSRAYAYGDPIWRSQEQSRIAQQLPIP
jgi:hypothetical protein